jgi:ferredoxin-thioredoxin reductase catalytic subunit
VPFTDELAQGLATNVQRYGYPLCPCRLTGGSRQADLDIICPCDYRDQDLAEYDTCY